MTRCELPLGPGYVLAVQRWAELEKAKIPAMALPTFKDLADKYMQDAIPLKSPRTQIENLRQMKNLLEFFCNSEPAQLEDIEPSCIWTNAASLAKLRLIERRPSSPTCGKRPADTLVISERDIKDGSIEIKQSKTSKKLRIAVAGELEALLYRIAKRKVRLRLRSLKLIVKEDGQALTKGGLRGRFEDARERAAESSPHIAAEIRRFQFRDLRAKAGTDKADDSVDVRQAQRQLGHSSIAMTEAYIRNEKGDKVKPTR